MLLTLWLKKYCESKGIYDIFQEFSNQGVMIHGNDNHAYIKGVTVKKSDPYIEFTQNFKCLLKKYPDLITMTLSNIFTMRLIGNKTHGDLAEIAISGFINQYMNNYRSIHVGKDLFRAKSQEEDIKVISEINNIEFPVS